MSDNGEQSGSPDSNQQEGMLLCRKSGITLLSGGKMKAVLQMPLPGIVIFVHGVNSDGEWYDQAEEGLCKGLNQRLKRCDEHLKHATAEGGQLAPARYTEELTDDGYINPKRSHKTFIRDDEHFSPVIRFRWGYKAAGKELQDFGEGVYLNEEEYWGGGPFANGCTTLPDLWGDGLSENLFLWMNVQHVNPLPGRMVFSCPPRPYFVLAALRLAKLVRSIRELQADVPITLVCHSQGNMVGMAAAFFGDQMSSVEDPGGKTGRCVADTYVLCNPPYSVIKSSFLQNWTDKRMKDRHGGTGRQTEEARIKTLQAFFDIVRKPASQQQEAGVIDKHMANRAHGFDAASDAKACGFGPRQSTLGRVTLYCNPHDQVISSTSIQGIGWRGMNKDEIKAAGGEGAFSQRVFAQGCAVGIQRDYHFWKDRPRELTKKPFWIPESPRVRYSLSQGLKASKNWGAKVLTVASAAVMVPITEVSSMFGACINASPHKDWCIPIQAPELPEAFMPEGQRFGKPGDFDEGYDAPGQRRNAGKAQAPGEPYAGDRRIKQRKGEPQREPTDAAQGDRDSEAAQRYEDHARLRMLAMRQGLVKPGEKVHAVDDPEKASDEHKAWRTKEIKRYLVENIDSNATDHSTIMTNPKHAEKALAYDVAVGMCRISAADLRVLRVEADWRLWKGLGDNSAQTGLSEYFQSGSLGKESLHRWANRPDSEGSMPTKIEDQREFPAPPPYRPPGD